MSFRRSDLQEAFFVPGTHAFRVFGYGTSDALDEVLASGYFGAAGALLQPGDLVYVRARAADERLPGAEAAAVHMALLMVRERQSAGSAVLRLVQDFGRSDDPAAPAATCPAPPFPPLPLTPSKTPPRAARPAAGASHRRTWLPGSPLRSARSSATTASSS